MCGDAPTGEDRITGRRRLILVALDGKERTVLVGVPMGGVVAGRLAVVVLLIGGTGALGGCQGRLFSGRFKERAARVDCAGARAASIETLRDLGYAVAGIYDPMPGRLTIIAAEKTTPSGAFQANVTIRCEDERAEITAAQPTLARHDPHFEEDFRAAWEERTSGAVRPPLASVGAVEVTRTVSSLAGSPGAAAGEHATAAKTTPQAAAGGKPQAAKPARPSAVQLPAAPEPTPGVPAAPHGMASPAQSPPSERVASAPPAVAESAPRPTVRLDLLSPADARERFGFDLASAGLLATRLAIVNRTGRAYVVSVPLLTLRHAGGAAVAPLAWSDASAQIAQSPAGRGWKAYDEISRELVTDQVLEPGASLSGILLYPAAEYGSVDLLLIDQRSARSERFGGAIPTAP